MAISWDDPPVCTAPSAPAFKRGLSAEQADWGSSVECYFSPPGPSGHPPLVNAGGQETGFPRAYRPSE